eukprot:764914-Hanusia_phi.AAC.4
MPPDSKISPPPPLPPPPAKVTYRTSYQPSTRKSSGRLTVVLPCLSELESSWMTTRQFVGEKARLVPDLQRATKSDSEWLLGASHHTPSCLFLEQATENMEGRMPAEGGTAQESSRPPQLPHWSRWVGRRGGGRGIPSQPCSRRFTRCLEEKRSRSRRNLREEGRG